MLRTKRIGLYKSYSYFHLKNTPIFFFFFYFDRLLWYSEGRLYQRRMLASLADYDTCTRATTSTAKSLKIGDLLGVFILYSICVGVSLFVFLLEMFMKLRRNTVVYNSLRPPMKKLDLMEKSNKSYLK